MTLTTAQLLQALSSRSRSASLLRGEGAPPNGWLKAAVGGSLAMQLGIALPGIRRIFGVTPIGPVDALVIAATALAPPLLNEYLKTAGGAGDGDQR
jgi:Ca2+-transporting ATPase